MHLRQLLLAVSIGLFTLSCAVPAIAAPEQRTSVKKTKRPLAKASSRRMAKVAPPRPSYGQLAGLHSTSDDLDLKSRDRKSTRLNSSHIPLSRMPSSA